VTAAAAASVAGWAGTNDRVQLVSLAYPEVPLRRIHSFLAAICHRVQPAVAIHRWQHAVGSVTPRRVASLYCDPMKHGAASACWHSAPMARWASNGTMVATQAVVIAIVITARGSPGAHRVRAPLLFGPCDLYLLEFCVTPQGQESFKFYFPYLFHGCPGDAPGPGGAVPTDPPTPSPSKGFAPSCQTLVNPSLTEGFVCGLSLQVGRRWASSVAAACCCCDCCDCCCSTA